MCAKKNIKTLILEKSLGLFNQYSWSKISLRTIAKELHISDGNLRYHYKTKEEIVLSLFSLMTAEMMALIEQKEVDFLAEMPSNFKAIFTIMYRYKFLFLEAAFIKKEYESYAILFEQLQESRRSLFQLEFERLKAAKILEAKFSAMQYELLFEQLFIISDSWIKYIPLDSTATYINQQIDYYAKLCFSLLVPYLVE